ncbi:hypothetical protein BJ138DRAFT_1154793 [Hygrophoropsis aurantiaca]|uniref:Uncharacterized protein n=1 Tax=Hygrophoropsis aurantiaca TaxID=72124 RepID=A0ACB8A967_9AGAM|nr:hypothetical protein BJ138DRAFT_1154793 [Hygrophoropsis aurantiaca]
MKIDKTHLDQVECASISKSQALRIQLCSQPSYCNTPHMTETSEQEHLRLLLNLPGDLNEGYTRNERAFFSSHMQPRNHLPPQLKANFPTQLRPPLFYYGWKINMDYVYGWAKDLNHHTEEELGDLESSKQFTAETTVDLVLKHLDIPDSTVSPRVEQVATPSGLACILSIADNYDRELPTAAIIDKLGRFYTGERTDPGQWWVDITRCIWEDPKTKKPSKNTWLRHVKQVGTLL